MMVTMSTGASAHGLCEFIDASPSPFHVCRTVAARLIASGYTELAETDRWPGSGPVLHRAGGIIDRLEQFGPGAAFPDRPFRIVGGHTDSPNLRVKQHPDRLVAGCQVVALEPHGGAWLNSWLDRDPVSAAGCRCAPGIADPSARSHRHPTAASAATGDPPRRGPCGAQTRPAAARQRGLGTGDRLRSFLGYVAEQAGSTRRTSSAPT